jgi:threonine/homoserine/homoserine lactone efflux protein
MVTIIPIFLQGASLGLSASISPGPLLAYLVSQSLAGGWKRGAIVALAPLLSDIPLVIAIVLLLEQVPAIFLSLISLVGGIYVIYLAWRGLQAWQGKSSRTVAERSQFHKSLGRAVLVNYSSPGPYMFWTLVNGPLLLSAIRISILHGVVFLLGFYGLFIGSMLVLAIIFSQAQRIGPKLVRILSLVSVMVLCIFGGILIYRGLSGIL